MNRRDPELDRFHSQLPLVVLAGLIAGTVVGRIFSMLPFLETSSFSTTESIVKCITELIFIDEEIFFLIAYTSAVSFLIGIAAGLIAKYGFNCTCTVSLRISFVTGFVFNFMVSGIWIMSLLLYGASV